MKRVNKISATNKSHKRDLRFSAVVFLAVMVVAGGVLLQWEPEKYQESQESKDLVIPAAPHNYTYSEKRDVSVVEEGGEGPWLPPEEPWIDPQSDPSGHLTQALSQELRNRFKQAVTMMHAKRFDEAVVALNRFLRLEPDNADAYTNLGYAFIGKREYEAAFNAFDYATDLNPAQGNAYYGAAIALEELGNLEGALGGMRSFLHLTDKGPGQIHVARARSAIWEWEAKLGRGDWGPTKGIPPGFTAEELRRNSEGVGIKMPNPDSADENGFMKYEIKYGKKRQLFEP